MFKPVSLPLLPVPWIFNGGQKKSLLLGVLPYKEFRQTLSNNTQKWEFTEM